MTTRTLAWSLAAIALLGLALRTVHLGADAPETLSTSGAELMDGAWYLAAALDGARGHEIDVDPSYQRALYTLPARAVFELLGGSFETAHLIPALFGALLVILGGGAGARAFGPRAGILTALFLAVGFVPVGYGRTPLVYGPLAAYLAGTFWLYAAGLRRLADADQPRASARLVAGGLLAAAIASVLALAVWLRPHAVLVLPPLLLGLLLWSPRRGAIAAGLGLVALGAMEMLDPPLSQQVLSRVRGYLGAGSLAPDALLGRVFEACWQSGLTRRAPIVGALAWLGVLAVARRHRNTSGGERAERVLEATLAAWLIAWVGCLGILTFDQFEGHLPLRHLSPALVPMALLAARTVDRLLSGTKLFGDGVSPAAALPWALVGAHVTQGTLWAFAWELDIAREHAATFLARGHWGFHAVTVTTATVIGLALWATQRRATETAIATTTTTTTTIDAPTTEPPAPTEAEKGPTARASGHAGRLAFASLALVACFAVDVVYLRPYVAEPQFTLKGVNLFAAQTFGPGARLVGNWAHGITYDAPAVRRHHPPGGTAEVLMARLVDKTHIVVSARAIPTFLLLFDVTGTKRPTPIALLTVRDGTSQIVVLRLPWAESVGYSIPDAERALGALSFGP